MDTKIRTAKPKTTGYRMPDGGGLHLFVTPKGAKVWRLRYKVNGGEQTLVIGPYPAISLADARAKRDAAKAALVAGTDPRRINIATAAAPTLIEMAREWHHVNRGLWKPHHAKDVFDRLKSEVLDFKPRHERTTLGDMPIEAVKAPMLVEALRQLEARGAIDMAHRIRARLDRVFAFAIGSGKCSVNPAAMIARAMAPHTGKGHYPAASDIESARAILRKIEAIPAHPVTRLCMRLLALTAQRPGEVCGALWGELACDGAEPIWVIPALRMKNRRELMSEARDHTVPLSRQAVETIDALRPLTSRIAFLFPSITCAQRPLTEAALERLLWRAGLAGVHVPHGWRACFSTVMNDRNRSDRFVIDLMLAHKPKDEVEAAYNRAQHMSRRREIAQEWADLLLEAMPSAVELVNMRRK